MTELPVSSPATGHLRLFFALIPTQAACKALCTVQSELRNGGDRLVHPDDLHLTLAYLGPVGAEQLACVQAVAGRVRLAPFPVMLTHQGYWGGPRIAWLAPAASPASLLSLVDQLWAGLSTCGFTRESRPYRAHVTLARKLSMCDERELPDPITWEASDFALLSSLSVPQPPRYKVLQRWPLVQPDGDQQSGLENQ